VVQYGNNSRSNLQLRPIVLLTKDFRDWMAQYKILRLIFSRGSYVSTSVDGTSSVAQYSFVEAYVEVNISWRTCKTTTHATKSNTSWSLLNFPITRNKKQASIFCHHCNKCCYLPISRAVIQLWICSNLRGIPLYTSYYSKEDWLSESRFYYSKSTFLLITFTSVVEIQNHTALTFTNF
jgi:hypothetical protein